MSREVRSAWGTDGEGRKENRNELSFLKNGTHLPLGHERVLDLLELVLVGLALRAKLRAHPRQQRVHVLLRAAAAAGWAGTGGNEQRAARSERGAAAAREERQSAHA
jgi:hypothetical protein